MRARGATLQKVLMGAALVVALVWNLAQASEIKGLRLTDGPTGTRAEISLDARAEFRVLRLSAPERLVVDLPASRVAPGVLPPAAAGIVRAVRTGRPTPDTARIVFDLAQAVAAPAPRLEQGADGIRLVIEWPGDGAASLPTTPSPPATANAALPPSATGAPATSATTSDVASSAASSAATSRLISDLIARGAAGASTAAATPPQSAPAPTPASTTTTTTAATPPSPAASAAPAPAATAPPPMRALDPVVRGVRPLVIAIDAGHGGQDPGAIGLGGKREKDVTLAIARELARQINATPGLKAVLTRDTDVFLPLQRRTQLARQARADMFISIHADAAENRKARGSSVYVLSLKGASSQRARWLADKENASDLIGGVPSSKRNDDTLTSVLIDLTQSGQMRASEDAASHVLAGLGRIGKHHKPRVEHANFAVLRTSDMPAMLVETAFISNPDDEAMLGDPAHQRRLATAVLDGINDYFTRQPPPGTMYAARAQLAAGSTGGAP